MDVFMRAASMRGMSDARGSGTHHRSSTMPRKREMIEPNEGDKRFVRRDEEGRFTEDQTDVGRSLAADRRSKSKTVAPKGMGDRGDQKKPKR
jgi:hypothetical protein